MPNTQGSGSFALSTRTRCSSNSARTSARRSPPPGNRWRSKLRGGFAPVQIDAFVGCYHRLRDRAGLTHAAALGALGEWLVVYALLADRITGAIDPGGRTAADRRGYAHQLLTPSTWKQTRHQLVQAEMLATDEKGAVVGIPATMLRAMSATRHTTDGTDRPFVALDRRAVREFVAELRGRDDIQGRGRLLATIVLLAGHSDGAGFVIASQRDLAAKLGVAPSRVHASMRLAIDAGYVHRGNRRRSNQQLDPAELLYVGEIRDRLGGREWTVEALAGTVDNAVERRSGFTPRHNLSGAPVSPPTVREGYFQETDHNPSGSSGHSPSVTGYKSGLWLDGWKVGPRTLPAYAQRTKQLVKAFDLNLPSLRELLATFSGKALGHQLRQTVSDAIGQTVQILEAFKADGTLPGDDERDLVDVMARLAAAADDIVRVRMHYHAQSAFASEDPDPCAPGSDLFIDGRLKPGRAAILLLGRLKHTVKDARRHPDWRRTAGNWRAMQAAEEPAPVTASWVEDVTNAASALAQDGCQARGTAKKVTAQPPTTAERKAREVIDAMAIEVVSDGPAADLYRRALDVWVAAALAWWTGPAPDSPSMRDEHTRSIVARWYAADVVRAREVLS